MAQRYFSSSILPHAAAHARGPGLQYLFSLTGVGRRCWQAIFPACSKAHPTPTKATIIIKPMTITAYRSIWATNISMAKTSCVVVGKRLPQEVSRKRNIQKYFQKCFVSSFAYSRLPSKPGIRPHEASLPAVRLPGGNTALQHTRGDEGKTSFADRQTYLPFLSGGLYGRLVLQGKQDDIGKQGGQQDGKE